MTDDERPTTADRAWLADWRRRVAELYADVRAIAADDPPTAWEAWRRERETLYRTHPQSPVPAAERDAFRAHHWPYDDRLRWTVAVEPARARGSRAAGRVRRARDRPGRAAQQRRRVTRVRPDRRRPAAAPRRRRRPPAVLDARLRGRPVPPVPRRDQRDRDVRRRALPARHGEERGSRRRPGRRGRSWWTRTSRSSRRAPSTRAGRARSPGRRAGSRRGSRRASDCAEPRRRLGPRIPWVDAQRSPRPDPAPARLPRAAARRVRRVRRAPTARRPRRSSGTT